LRERYRILFYGGGREGLSFFFFLFYLLFFLSEDPFFCYGSIYTFA